MNKFSKVDQEKNNNLRQIEINEYYSLKNNAIIEIFKIIIIALIPITILVILTKFAFIPKNIVSTFSIIIIFAVIIIITMKILSISSRDPRNFNHFKIPFDANTKELEDAGKLDSISNLLSKEFHGNFGCFDDSCCSKDMKFDNKKKKCILNSNFQSLNNHDNDKNKGEKHNILSDQMNYVKSVNEIKSTNNGNKHFKEIGDDLRNYNLSEIHDKM